MAIFLTHRNTYFEYELMLVGQGKQGFYLANG